MGSANSKQHDAVQNYVSHEIKHEIKSALVDNKIGGVTKNVKNATESGKITCKVDKSCQSGVRCGLVCAPLKK